MEASIIDFETYYTKDISVVKMGNPNYVAAADAYIVSVSVGGVAYCGTIAEMGPTCEQIAKDDTVMPVAANSNFDQCWWEKYYPAFKQQWHCVLDQGSFNQFPHNLAGLAKVGLGIDMDKTTRDEMKNKRYEDLSPEEQQNVQSYCLNDTLIEAELFESLPKMSAVEEKIAQHTRMMNRRGVAINSDLLSEDKTRLEAMRFDAFKKIPWHTDAKPLSYPALVKYCAMKNIPAPKSTAKDDEECEDLMSDHPELNVVLGQMRRYRQSNAMLKKLLALQLRVTPDGVLPLDFIYCGAPHTRRWSSKGVNIQNLDKEPITVLGEKPADVSWESLLSGEKKVEGLEWVWTRNWIMPRPGYTFLILDYAQIEPRCLNWLVGNDEMMQALRSGFSYYESYAVSAKGWRGDAGTLKKEFGKERYTKLKNECLGCGYGMGPDKYTSYAGVTLEEAKEIVKGFREANPKVVEFWKFLDNQIKTAARRKERHLGVELPTGELLQYFGIRTSASGYQAFKTKGDFTGPSTQYRLWGGTLTENVTQRMARDVLATAIVNLEEAGLRVAFHCHDEVILEVPIDSKEEAKATAYAILQRAPEWAPDLPLAVEGDFADSYTK